jgi:hypothetical protein
VAVLALAAGLLDVPALRLGLLADRLLVGDLGLADVGLDRELALQAVHDDLEVQLAHAGDLGLPGLLVGLDLEGRVLLHQLGEAVAELLLVALALRLDRERYHGRGELDRLEHDRRARVADRVAGRHVLEADRRGDVAGVNLLDLLALVRVHLQQPADALALALGRVEHAVARLHRAGVDTDEGELAHEGVGHDLEDERAEGRVVLGRPLHQLAVVVGVVRHRRRHVQRRRQIVDDRVEHRLDALVLEGRAADHREQLHRDRGLADARLDLGHAGRLARDELLHQVVVARLVGGFGHLLDHLLAVQLCGLLVLRGDLDHLELGAQLLVQVADRLHLHEVDHALVLVLLAERQLDRDRRLGAQPLVHRLDRVQEVRADAVHLVHERDARDLVLVGLAPDGLGLRLDAGDRIEHRDGAVEHPQRALHLGREVDVARGVDDVDAVVLPEAGGGGGGDRDPALLLLLHPVHRGGAFVNLADLVVDAGVIEDALGSRRLAGVDVRRDPDVPGALERGGPGHCLLLLRGYQR